jgi:glutathione S-transferase
VPTVKPERINIEQARRASGLRIVTLAHVPSPWGEALKGILHIKQMPHARVGHMFGSPTEPLQEWTAQDSFPVMAWNDERPRTTWIEQLYLAERLAPTPRLIPERLEDRVLMLGYSNEICGENGLGWTERLRGVHQALAKPGGDPAGVSAYLGEKYGYTPEIGQRAAGRVVSILTALAARLELQRTRGSRFFVGDTLSAVDVYWATFSNAMRPLAPELCPMPPIIREMFTTTEPIIVAAMHPLLFEHRDFIFTNYLELPVDLS